MQKHKKNEARLIQPGFFWLAVTDLTSGANRAASILLNKCLSHSTSSNMVQKGGHSASYSECFKSVTHYRTVSVSGYRGLGAVAAKL